MARKTTSSRQNHVLLRAIAAGLNACGILMARGNGQWSATQVVRLWSAGWQLAAN